MKLLVHACCGPCSIMPTRLLCQQGHDITVFYANSNITPQEEYAKRLHELRGYAAGQGFEVIEGAYDPAAWEREVAPIGEAIKEFSPALGSRHAGAQGGGIGEACAAERLLEGGEVEEACTKGADARECDPVEASSGSREREPQSVAELLDDENRRERCRACYRMRLAEAAAYAAREGYDALCTTLAVSPYQFTDIIREELERACAQAGVEAHFEDYRPYYDEATRISRELGMYRQNYCGCRFSVKEGQATRAFIKRQRAAAKAGKAAERAAEEQARRLRAAEKRAYAEERARKRAVLKELREQRRREKAEGT